MSPGAPVHAAPTPRALPLALHVRMLFGGAVTQFGWMFAVFGMFFVFIFDPGAAIVDAFAFRGTLASVEGVSTGYEPTNLTINGRRVYATSFSYEVGGVAYSATSHATGTWTDAGEPVVVQHPPDAPANARIAGYRVRAGSAVLSFVFLFPLVGFGLGGGGFVRGWLRRGLLINGAVARGTLLKKETTNTVVNNQPVMKLTFEFEPEQGGSYRAVARTHQEYRLEDEERELLVYDPRNPSRALMLDTLPSEPRFNERGEVDESAPGLPMPAYLALPGLFTLAVVQYVASLL